MKLPWRRKKEFFTAEETQQLVAAIQEAERRTSGEVRLFIESRCRFVDPMDRAKEIFLQLGMDKTELRNATLIYLAMDDHQTAVLGDRGIHEKVGEAYWKSEVEKMIQQFRADKLVDGICLAISDLGQALSHHFPYDSSADKNELPDEIVFGK